MFVYLHQQTNKTLLIMTTIETLRTLAANFLALADELNEKVSAYIDGSNAKKMKMPTGQSVRPTRNLLMQ